MSGGSIGDYDWCRVQRFVEEAQELLNRYEQEGSLSFKTLQAARELLPTIELAAAYMKELDYLAAGDTGEDTFLERVQAAEQATLGYVP